MCTARMRWRRITLWSGGTGRIPTAIGPGIAGLLAIGSRIAGLLAVGDRARERRPSRRWALLVRRSHARQERHGDGRLQARRGVAVFAARLARWAATVPCAAGDISRWRIRNDRIKPYSSALNADVSRDDVYASYPHGTGNVTGIAERSANRSRITMVPASRSPIRWSSRDTTIETIAGPPNVARHSKNLAIDRIIDW